MAILIFTEPRRKSAKVHGVRHVSHLVENAVGISFRLNDNSLAHNWWSYLLAIWSFFTLALRLLYHRIRLGELTFYAPLNMSTFGLLKILLTFSVLDLFKNKSRFVLHIHRSDFGVLLGRNEKLFAHILRMRPEFIVLCDTHKNEFNGFLKNLSQENFILWKVRNPFELQLSTKIVPSSNFICIANYIELKGQYSLCDIIVDLNSRGFNYRLDFYGEIIDAGYHQKLKERYIDYGFFTFNDSIHGVRKQELMKNSAGFLYASEMEAYSIILIEASILCERVVCYNVGYTEDIFKPGFDGLIKAHSKFEFAEAIARGKGFLEGYRKTEEHSIDNFNRCIKNILN